MADDRSDPLADLEGLLTGDDSAAEAPADDSAAADTADDTPPEPISMQDASWGELVDSVDLNNDGIADVEMRDADGDGQIDYVSGDLSAEGLGNVELQDADGDGTLDTGTGAENWAVLAPISDLDPDWINRDGANLDSDQDDVTNADEVAIGSNPLVGDSDGDGFNDGWETGQGSDPTDWQSSTPAEQVAWSAEQEIAAEIPAEPAWDASADLSVEAAPDLDLGSDE